MRSTPLRGAEALSFALASAADALYLHLSSLHVPFLLHPLHTCGKRVVRAHLAFSYSEQSSVHSCRRQVRHDLPRQPRQSPTTSQSLKWTHLRLGFSYP